MKRGQPKAKNEKGARDVGKIIKVSDTKVRVEFEGGEVFPIEVSETTVPKILIDVLRNKKVGVSLPVDVTLDSTNTKILFVKPLTGTFDLKFIKFYAKENTPPVIETHTKGNNTYGSFSAVLEVQNITGGKSTNWRGARFNVMFFDSFGQDEDGNLLVESKGEASDFLNDFMDAIGVGNHTIPYSENPLPEIEKIALEESRIFSGDIRRVVSKKGERFANVVYFHTYSLDVEDDGDEYKDEKVAEEVNNELLAD